MPRAWLMWTDGRQAVSADRLWARIEGSGGGGKAKSAMSRQGHGLRWRTDRRAGTSNPAAERRDGLFCLLGKELQLFRATSEIGCNVMLIASFTNKWMSSGIAYVYDAMTVADCSRIKQAEKQYMDAFNDELESFKDRIRKRAQVKIEEAMQQVEEVGRPVWYFIYGSHASSGVLNFSEIQYLGTI